MELVNDSYIQGNNSDMNNYMSFYTNDTYTDTLITDFIYIYTLATEPCFLL
jgi:hypothetical protein